MGACRWRLEGARQRFLRAVPVAELAACCWAVVLKRSFPLSRRGKVASIFVATCAMPAESRLEMAAATAETLTGTVRRSVGSPPVATTCKTTGSAVLVPLGRILTFLPGILTLVTSQSASCAMSGSSLNPSALGLGLGWL